jgi:glycosyltransferase involved in cell wall biosynthesis
VVDAFVAGTPLLTQASALHGPEIDYLEHGVNGLVVASDAAEDYAQAAERLLREPAALARLRDGCSAGAQRYTIDHMVENFAAGILGCLQRPPHDG